MNRTRLILPVVLVMSVLSSRNFARGAEGSEHVLDVGSARQVFIDGRFLQDAQGVQLCVHPPRKTGEMTIKPERSWEQGGIGPYSNVLWQEGVYHMWYHSMSTVQWDSGNDLGAICYARSKDGITWERPHLGIVEIDGKRDNNIVFGRGAAGVTMGQDGGIVFVDPTAPADERYRLAIRLGEVGEGIHIYSSPDGLHWRLTHKSAIIFTPMERGHHLDSQNVLFWDDRISKYVAYVRKNLMIDSSPGRAIARAESADFGHFPVVQDMPAVLGPDDKDLFHFKTAVVDYYMSAAIKYPWAADAYYMFPTTYYHYLPGMLPEFGDEVPTNAGPLDSQFAASRDGIAWERYDRRPFVPLGMKGQFDWASTRVVHGLVPSVDGREMYLYYRGSDWLHGWDRDERNKRLLTRAGLGASQNIAVLSRLVSRRDGFVSARGDYTGGTFHTPPLRFKGDRLLLNVDTSATGIVRVGLRDEAGKPVPGFGLDDCDRIHTANEVNRLVTWQRNSDLSALAGHPVSLEFEVRDADLYAFQFADGGAR